MNKVGRYIHTKKAYKGVANLPDNPFTSCKGGGIAGENKCHQEKYHEG